MSVLIFYLVLLWMIVIIITLFQILVRPFIYNARLTFGLGMKIYQISLPKKITEGQSEKEMISVMEQMYSSLTYLKNHKGANAIFLEHPYISLEMVSPSHHDEIHFYIGVPAGYEIILEKQIHGFFPEAEIIAVPDYNPFTKGAIVKTSSFGVKKPPILPIRTYQQLEADSLQSITSALSKIQVNESAVVQVLVQPSSSHIFRLGKETAKNMHKGMSFEQAYHKAHNGFWYEIKESIINVFRKKIEDENSSISPVDQETLKSIEEKTSKIVFRVNVRLLVSAQSDEKAESILSQLEAAFAQFNNPHTNILGVSRATGNRKLRSVYLFIFRIFDRSQTMFLNTEELTSIFHFPMGNLSTPKIKWIASKKSHPPVNLPTEGIIIGKNTYRGIETLVRIGKEDRRRHMYVIGQTGTGKTSFMKKMIEQDLKNGEGIALLDPNGDFAQEVIGMIPRDRSEDLIYFNPSDIDRPLGLNILEASTPQEQDFVTQEMIQIFYQLVSDPSMIGPIFEHNMRNAMFALMADTSNPGTLVEIPRLFTDESFRSSVLSKVTDPLVKAFWEKEFPASQRGQQAGDMIGYLLSKLGRFIENEMIRNIIGQERSAFNFREVMDEGKILICNLSKGGIGEINSKLLGMLIVSKLQMAAFRRNDMREQDRKDFYLYLDEFQNFTTDSISTILSEARKYRLNMTLAHQFIGQLNEPIRNAVFGNVGTNVAFRVGPEDAEFLEKKFAPDFDASDIASIDNLNAITALMIQGQTSKAFNLQVMFADKSDESLQGTLIELSRLKYGKPRDLVQKSIMYRSKLGDH
jgi:type IV secretory pathway TraG/TraD family ATPase VirD4